MIDRGLLVSVVLMAAVVAVTARLWAPRRERAESVLATASSKVIVGVAIARLVSMAIDDPAGLSRIKDVLVIRGGMEFWPGVAAGSFAIAVAARKAAVPVALELSDLVPYALVAYGTYEATCVVRDGCFGPLTSFGLRPGGVGPRELPIGLFVAVAVFGLAAIVRQLAARRPSASVLVAAAGVAVTRAAAAIWLPKIGAGPTRPQLESVVVGAGTCAALLVMTARSRRRGGIPITDEEAGAGAT